jgi:hypothetical protein
MAIYPCEMAPHRYIGPQRSAYITFVQGSSTDTRKIRLCPEHFVRGLDSITPFLQPLDAEQKLSMVCDTCGKDRQVSVFATFYDQNAEPAAWVGDFCGVCASRVRDLPLWSNGRPR